MARFTLPRDIYFGSGAINELKNLKGRKKAIVITGGSSMKKGGFLQRVEDVLKETGLEVLLFEGVEPDPSIETVFRGAKVMQEFEPDVIVSIGGGSPIDAAKAMWVFYEHPELTFDDIKDPFSIPQLRKKAIFVAIPSTSGTATEVTAFSVITDYSTHIKYPLADFEITPDIAILDTDIPLTMPQKLTAHTGMDALTHAIEAYVATARSPFSDPLALKAISDIYDSIIDSYNNNVEARGKMHIAQCLAGMAFSNALLGIVHSLAHKVGAQYDIPHGCCNAIMLPYVIQYNSKVCMERFADIARMLGLPGGTDKQLTDSLVTSIRTLNDKLNIPNSYKAYGVPEDQFKATLDFIAENAVLDPCTGSNPRATDVELMRKVLACTYYGEDVNF
ncbi:MAG: iron-containing alcohol dehydrogenase [Candidatus Cellulosilyticum pullistercoris]|uniref:Iron-containing alcohol dehydrogenase n=1 Tax=Candidatus Cellulosilyticum pullistercoris TaxID=2838521 RepID=A0A9E2KCL2_9FIRM|nr:iron-containing alcohol dehydrogenase [Candidatus Cellulosilyticum pullistercoris]